MPDGQYNPIFERLVTDGEASDLEGVVAYGLYKIAKREWAREIGEKEKRKPTDAELAAYVATWTPSRLSGAKEQAAQILAEYANEVIEDAEPKILREALRGSFWKSVGSSVFAALLYTLLLIALVVVASIAGIDLFSIFQKLSG